MASQSEYVTTQFSDSNSQTKCEEVSDFRWLIGCFGRLVLKFCFRFKLYWKFLYEIRASPIETSSRGLQNMKRTTAVHFTMTSGIWSQQQGLTNVIIPLYSSKLVSNSYALPLSSVSAGIRSHHLKLSETSTYCWTKNWHHRRNTRQIRAETDLIHVPRYIAGSSHNADLTIQWGYLQDSFTGFASVYNEGLLTHPIQRPHTATPCVNSLHVSPQAIMLRSPMNSHVSLQLSSPYLPAVTNPKIPVIKMKTQASPLWMKSLLFCYHTWKQSISCFNVYGFVMYLGYHGLSFLWHSCVGNSDVI